LPLSMSCRQYLLAEPVTALVPAGGKHDLERSLTPGINEVKLQHFG
jgi:hypothetical protein